MRDEPKSSQQSPISQYEKLACIINALGDPDALKIFDKASTEFESGKTTIKKLRITPRKYYRNLKKLNEIDLINHSGNKCKLSPFGELLHRLLFKEIATYLLADQNVSDPLKNIGSRAELTIIDSYKDLVSVLIASIEKSKSEIFLATKYIDMTVIQSILIALERNIKIKTITSEKVDYSGFMKLLGGFAKSFRPNSLKFIIGGENNYRSGTVPLSFMMVDNEIAIFEIPEDEFKLGFVSTDKEIVNTLSRLFQEIWSKSKALHLPSRKFI